MTTAPLPGLEHTRLDDLTPTCDWQPSHCDQIATWVVVTVLHGSSARHVTLYCEPHCKLLLGHVIACRACTSVMIVEAEPL